MSLTIKEIDGAKPTDKPYKLADGGGLCLLVPPSGAKLWRWRYRFDGKEKMMALGEYPLVSLKERVKLVPALAKSSSNWATEASESKSLRYCCSGKGRSTCSVKSHTRAASAKIRSDPSAS